MSTGARGQKPGTRGRRPEARGAFASGLLLLAVAAGCRTGDRDQAEMAGGWVEVEWQDSTGTVRFGVPADARWCASDSLLTITAVRNDTALGLLLLGTDSQPSGLGAGVYSLMPARVFIPWRPRSVAALRLAEAFAVRNYESGTGQITVTADGSSAAGLSGTMDLRLVASAGPDSLHLTGSFRGLRIVPADLPCGRADKPGAVPLPSPPPTPGPLPAPSPVPGPPDRPNV